QLYLLDAQGEPVPPGVVGELYLGGIGLARGYHHRPDLTAERFLPNPFAQEPGARLYRTGDLARSDAAGRLVFVGRRDQQVKLRGYRIELEQIAAQLRAFPGVADGLVLLRSERDTPQLVAYVVAAAPTLDLAALRAFLRARLPSYMLPHAIVPVTAWPQTPNGKIDRQGLPLPEREDAALDAALVAPGTPLEELLAGIWADVLRLPRVGVRDNFFALGGHSLLATQVISRVRAAFQLEIPVRSLFDAPTIEELARRIADARGESPEAIPVMKRASREQVLPLSFAQQRLWFLDQLEPGSRAYAMPIALRLHGPLDRAALQHSLDALVARHESLRTAFGLVGDTPVQQIAPAQPLALRYVVVAGTDAAAREGQVQTLLAAEVQQPFVLATGPLLRATLFGMDAETHVLLLNLHHIIADGWSMQVLLRELVQLYR
ncbi:MAG TPA: condensation domain-containing protein, partial [Herpetosiphonaceae bacterium]